MLDKPSSFSENINSTLITLKDFILPYCWVTGTKDKRLKFTTASIIYKSYKGRQTLPCNPNPCKVIWMNFIFNKLSISIFMTVNSSSLSMMNFTIDNSWIRSSLDFKPCDSIVVNIICLKIAQSIVEGKDSNISSMMNMISSKYGISKVLNPNPPVINKTHFFEDELEIVNKKYFLFSKDNIELVKFPECLKETCKVRLACPDLAKL